MSRKLKIAVLMLAIVALISVSANIIFDEYLLNKNKQKSEEKEVSEIEGTETSLSEILYNEETGEYYIENETTGEIVHTSYNEDDLYIYTIDPDYDPKNSDEPVIQEY